MNRHEIPLPGEDPYDPPNRVDTIAGHLERIKIISFGSISIA